MEAGYTECCFDVSCLGAPTLDCFCDTTCRAFGDCCHDIEETCPGIITVQPSRKFDDTVSQELHTVDCQVCN